jgi:hypothetical protein
MENETNETEVEATEVVTPEVVDNVEENENNVSVYSEKQVAGAAAGLIGAGTVIGILIHKAYVKRQAKCEQNKAEGKKGILDKVKAKFGKKTTEVKAEVSDESETKKDSVSE